MSRSFKQRFRRDVSDLLASISVDPEPRRTLVSWPLFDALVEIEAEVNSPRTNWHLVAALTGAKSYIVTVPYGRSCDDPFWAEERADDEPSIYGILDGLHFRAAMRVGVLASGLSVFGGTADGVEIRHGEVDTQASPGSPTLRLIAAERARIEADPADDGG
ncbi:MAG: hypothetical protein ABFE08_16270 [Armatimonadia bacterium]